MTIFFSYIFLGISLAAPLGPINAAQIDKGIKNGFLHAWLVGLGSMVADVFYMMCVYFGLVHFLETSFIKSFLYLFGCFVLTYTGIESFLSVKKITNDPLRKSESLRKSFSSGFLLSISNPITILFWLGIYGSVLAKAMQSVETDQLLLYSGAIFIGLFIWDISMAAVSSTFRKILNTKFLVSISILSGLSLIGFGVYFGLEAMKILF
ncbi:LysE family transporter [Heyndrickxia sp. NPDC080065]|uniref:LysE family transporter n=1 Tax=Heyndrickxia sp. NPDC080065 TaxID=3390568 RepID=UPI003D045035